MVLNKKIVSTTYLLAALCLVLTQCAPTSEKPMEAEEQNTELTDEEKLLAIESEAKVLLGENIGTQIFIRAIPVTRNLLFRSKFMQMVGNDKKTEGGMFSENAFDGVQLNELIHLRLLTNHILESGVTPNVDTQYSPVFLDLSEEPVVVQVPVIKDRYYSIQFTDAYLTNVDYIGGNKNETEGALYIITGPNYSGEIPAGMTEMKYPTNIGFVALRILNRNTPGDTENVNAIQDQFSFQPLSQYQGKVAKNPSPVIVPERKPDGVAFYKYMLNAVKAHPDPIDDDGFWSLVSQIGVYKDYIDIIDSLDADIQKGLLQALPKAKKIIAWKAKHRGYKSYSKWNIDHVGGSFGDDILARAEGAVQGFIVHDADQCQYYHTYHDGDGNPLVGGKKYKIHFDKEQLHQADAFWSLVAYDENYDLVPNDDFHYAVSDRSEGLVYNEDGSLDIYLQATEPEIGKSNWVPIPKEGVFKINFRNYVPKKTLLDIEKVEGYLPPLQNIE